MASNLVVARGGVEYVPPISLAFWRWVLVFLILLPFTFTSLKKNFNFIKKEYKQIFFIGAMGCGVCGAFPFLAGQTTTITNMGIIYTSSPIFIILISNLFFKEKINFLKIIGLCSCLIGVFVIIIKGNLTILFNLKFNIGDLWMLAAAIGWALYSIYLYYWKTNLEIFQRFTLIAFFGAASLLPFYIIEEFYFVRTVFNSYFFSWVSFAAISPGIIAFTLYTLAQKKLGASVTGFTLYIFTVYGAIYGYFLFDEQLEKYHYIGTILVFTGVYLVREKFNMYFIKIITIIIIIYFLFIGILYFFQRSLLYHPSENNYSDDNLTVSIEKIKIKTQDNIDLLGWYHKKKSNNYKTIIFLHGNAGSLQNRIHKINHFKNMNINFLIIAWRGFSGNKGSPSEKGLYEDAKSAVRWLKQKGLNEEDIIIYGESLGTGIAVEIAQNSNFAGVILESPFTSMIDAAKNKYPIFPIRFLLKDKYESDKKIKNIKSPLLIMHGKVDKIVPFWMGEKIYNMANEPKYSYFTKYDNHMMEYDESFIIIMKKFIESLN